MLLTESQSCLFEQTEIAQYTPEERQDYEESLKNFRDWYSALKTAEKKGRAEGREEGIQEGIIKTAQNMKKEGLSVSLIARMTGLTEQEIAEL